MSEGVRLETKATKPTTAGEFFRVLADGVCGHNDDERRALDCRFCIMDAFDAALAQGAKTANDPPETDREAHGGETAKERFMNFLRQEFKEHYDRHRTDRMIPFEELTREDRRAIFDARRFVYKHDRSLGTGLPRPNPLVFISSATALKRLFRRKPAKRKEVKMTEREVHVGDVVVFHDPKGQAHNALVIAVFDRKGYGENPLVNLVYASGDKSRQDSYGRQIERDTSVPHASDSGVHGYVWRYPDEPAPTYTPPTET